MQAPPDDDPELIDVRPDEQLDLSRLEPWLRAHLPGLAPDAPIAVRQFGGGHANLTYLLRAGDAEYVLRRPPLGPVAPTSHDMSREHRVLARLHERFPLVELGYLLGFWCEAGDDPEWIRAAGMPTHHDGCLTRDEVIARYAAQTGFDVEPVRWHHVFGLFKLIVILQQIYIRFLRGQTADRRFATFGRRIDGLADKGRALVRTA